MIYIINAANRDHFHAELPAMHRHRRIIFAANSALLPLPMVDALPPGIAAELQACHAASD